MGANEWSQGSGDEQNVISDLGLQMGSHVLGAGSATNTLSMLGCSRTDVFDVLENLGALDLGLPKKGMASWIPPTSLRPLKASRWQLLCRSWRRRIGGSLSGSPPESWAAAAAVGRWQLTKLTQRVSLPRQISISVQVMLHAYGCRCSGYCDFPKRGLSLPRLCQVGPAICFAFHL